MSLFGARRRLWSTRRARRHRARSVDPSLSERAVAARLHPRTGQVVPFPTRAPGGARHDPEDPPVVA